MRKSTFAMLVAGLVLASPAKADITQLPPMSEGDVKSFCDGVSGGKFSRAPDGSTYGCVSKCGQSGNSCNLTCKKGEECTNQVPEGRVGTSGVIDPRLGAFLSLNPAPAKEDKFDYGLLGLLGLLGLAGLAARRRELPADRHST